MVWPVHNSPFSLRSPGCLEGCKMVDRGQSKKTERPCVEYLINRFESETENSVAGAAAIVWRRGGLELLYVGTSPSSSSFLLMMPRCVAWLTWTGGTWQSLLEFNFPQTGRHRGPLSFLDSFQIKDDFHSTFLLERWKKTLVDSQRSGILDSLALLLSSRFHSKHFLLMYEKVIWQVSMAISQKCQFVDHH